MKSKEFPSMSLNGKQCCRLICLSVALVLINCYVGHQVGNIVHQVEATLWSGGLGLVRPLSLNINKNKQKNQLNGTVTAQLNKSVNGTTVGNVAFLLNNPAAAYIWSNPLARVLTRNVPNKSLQWQFGRLPTAGAAPAAAAPAPAAAPRPAAAGVIRAGQAASMLPARPVPAAAPTTPAAQYESASDRPANQVALSPDDASTGSFVVPADARRFAAG